MLLMVYHIVAFIVGFALDLILGDPYWMPHPIRWIGKWIQCLDEKLWTENKEKTFRRGIWMVLLVTGVVGVTAFMAMYLSYRIYPVLGMVVESIMTYQILAMKCLKVESMKVYDKLATKDVQGARKAVSMIVGRDTEKLNEVEITKAAIETVAENTSDGVIAPLIYTGLGSPVLGYLYKAINTMDSMIGYKNERYLLFGRAAARVDDIANFLPSRISAILMIGAGLLLRYDYKNAWKIWRRDRDKHASPNSAQTESVCAGALDIQLAGDAFYFGKRVKKPFIGDGLRTVDIEDIRRVNRMMYVSAFLCGGILLAVLGGIYLWKF